jgi:ABC-type sugar transport system substrate-binding protein
VRPIFVTWVQYLLGVASLASYADTLDYRISLFLRDGGEYQELLRDDCHAAARRHGFAVQTFVAGDDLPTQVRQIEASLAEPPGRRPNCVIVAPVNESALRVAAHAAARLGVAWVMLLRWGDYIDELRRDFPRLPLFAVLADQLEVGRIQGRQFRALLPRGGEAVYIRGPLGTSSTTRRFTGLQEVLQGSAIDLFVLNSDFSVAGGERVMRNQTQIFQKPGPAKFIVGAQNDAMAMGARKAVEDAAQGATNFSMARIAFCGSDGTPGYGQRLVTEGKLATTVIMPSCAGRAVDEIASALSGKPLPPSVIALKPSGFPEPHRIRGMTTLRPAAPSPTTPKRKERIA